MENDFEGGIFLLLHGGKALQWETVLPKLKIKSWLCVWIDFRSILPKIKSCHRHDSYERVGNVFFLSFKNAPIPILHCLSAYFFIAPRHLYKIESQ